MAYSVDLYYNTGFDLGNSPDGVGVLTNMAHNTYDSVVLRQNNDISRIRISAEWDDVKKMDYAKIGDVCYFVTQVNMVADKTAEIELQLDSIGTIGVANVRVLDGWCRRRIIPQTQQALENYEGDILPEPWSPMRELVMETQRGIQPTGNSGVYNVVVSTVSLSSASKVARSYEYNPTGVEGGGESCLVPNLNEVPEDRTKVRMVYNGNDIGEFQFPSSCAYDPSSILAGEYTILKSLNDCRSLGVESAITASYMIPAVWVNPSATEVRKVGIYFGQYMTLVNNSAFLTTKFNYKYKDTIENAKVFALYNNFTIVSEASGNSQDYSFSQVYHIGDEAFQVSMWADLSPNGATYCRPHWYYNDAEALFVGTVKGAGWMNMEQRYGEASGRLLNEANVTREATWQKMNANLGMVNTSIGSAGSIAGDTGSAVGGGLSFVGNTLAAGVKLQQNLADMGMKFYQQNYTVAPTINFPYIPSVQSYVGNGFTVIRYRLHDNDVLRFDRFLHMYGESVDEQFFENMFHKKQHFDFLQVDNLNIIVPNAPWGTRYYTDFATRFKGGVRIWHTAPNSEALEIGGNPDA